LVFIIDFSGKIVSRTPISVSAQTHRMRVDDLPAGMYLVQAIGSGRVYRSNFVKGL